MARVLFSVSYGCTAVCSLNGKIRAAGLRFSPTGALSTTLADGSMVSPSRAAWRVPSNQRYTGVRFRPQVSAPNRLS